MSSEKDLLPELEQQLYDILVKERAVELPELTTGPAGPASPSLEQVEFYNGLASLDQKEEAWEGEREPMGTILAASVGLVLQNMGLGSVTRGALNQLSDWVDLYLHTLIRDMHTLTEVQRRRRASKGDLELLLREGYFSVDDIHGEYLKTKAASKGVQRSAVQNGERAKDVYTLEQGGPMEPEELSEDDPESVFFHELPHIMASSKRHLRGAPKWVPQLPPEYTYKATPKFGERLTDPRKMRELLVDEGRLGEKALDHIMSRDRASDGADKDADVEMSSSDGMDEEGLSPESAVTSPEPQQSQSQSLAPASARGIIVTNKVMEPHLHDGANNKFDVVEFAERRMKQLEERKQKEEERVRLRQQSEEAMLSRNLGSYTAVNKFPEGYNEQLAKFYKGKLEKVTRRVAKQKLDREKKKAEAKKRRIASNQSIEVGGKPVKEFVDEDVDFEMEFSDAEAIEEEIEAPPAPDGPDTVKPIVAPVEPLVAPVAPASRSVSPQTVGAAGTTVVPEPPTDALPAPAPKLKLKLGRPNPEVVKVAETAAPTTEAANANGGAAEGAANEFDVDDLDLDEDDLEDVI